MKVHRDIFFFGNKPQMQQFKQDLRNAVPGGWQPYDPKEAWGAKFAAFTIPESKSHPAAILWVPVEDDHAHITAITPTTEHELSMDQCNAVVHEFASFACPVAKNIGLVVQDSGENAGIEKWLTEPAVKKLRAFAEGANKSTGSSHPQDFKRWCDFIIECHKDRRFITDDMLGRYLLEEAGWPEDKAVKLILEYEFACGLLNVYDGYK